MPAGVFTAVLGSCEARAAIAWRVALAIAWTAADFHPSGALVPDSSASSGSAVEDARGAA
ncbi:MAG: hypothetical protein ACRDPM_14460 [Solirubrobacteraceae bacterium]